MSTNRDIRDRYTEIIGKLAKKHRPTLSDHEIANDVQFAQCIGFAQRFIVGKAGDDPHYRYNRYRRALNAALQRHRVSAGTVIHVDIGCGPGLFTWVVMDYFRLKSSVEVVSYGFDHAPKMVKLARWIWKRLDETESYSCHHNIEKITRSASKLKAKSASIIVTFGHVLVQTHDNQTALDSFADIVAEFAQINDCRLVAVDGQKEIWREMFGEACDRLKAAMEKRGLIVDNPHIGSSEMWTIARARRRA